jgi:hypothetical protein
MLGTKTYIVLSTPTAVKDLLDKKSSIYSSRPDLYLGHDIVGRTNRFVTMESRIHNTLLKFINILELTFCRNTAQCGDRSTR